MCFKSGGLLPTKAKDIENMNEPQLKQEIKKAQRKLNKANSEYQQYSKVSAQEQALRETFPLGTGGLSRIQSEKYSGKLAERALERGKKLEQAINNRKDAENRIKMLNSALKDVKGTDKTQKQIKDEQKKEQIKNNLNNAKWKSEKVTSDTYFGEQTRQTYKWNGYTITKIDKGYYTLKHNNKEFGGFWKTLTEAKSFAISRENGRSSAKGMK